jgi:hypothetical protein
MTGFNPWYYYKDNVLIKEKKPCVPGNQVHIKTYEGCYNVYDVFIDGFYIQRKGVYVKIPWSDFICLKGNGNSKEAKLKKELNQLITLNIIVTEKIKSLFRYI